MESLKFKNFDIFFFKDVKDSEGKSTYDNLVHRDDLFISISKDKFIDAVRGAPSKRVNYLEYWKENAKRYMIDIYDELISRRLEIEAEINKSDGYDVYFVRKK